MSKERGTRSGERGATQRVPGEVRVAGAGRLGVGRSSRRPAFTTGMGCVTVLLLASTSFAQPSFSFDDIRFWVGAGDNRAAVAIDWHEYQAEPPALVWGYRWDGTAHGNDMLAAVVAADSRLFAKLGGSRSDPNAVYGLGYDASGDGQFAIDDDTVFDAEGFAFTGPADLAMASDRGDYYAEGWFTGFWHYGVAPANPFNGASWSDTAVGMASRLLTDGAWDSWTFSATFNFASFAENPIAAAPPITPGDFNQDGRVDASDYTAWRNAFGSTSHLAADGSGNGIVDAADYAVWRKAFGMTKIGTSPAQSINIPEPTSMLLAGGIFMTPFMFRRKANRD
ncbi:MAG TPA: dockerin type I domain-containing protein [Lacipirellulaceae bacterium]